MTALSNFFKRVIIVGAQLALLGNGLPSVSGQSNYQIQQNFGQNLTSEIDKVLRGNDPIHTALISEALQWSTTVYYESGKLKSTSILITAEFNSICFTFYRYFTQRY